MSPRPQIAHLRRPEILAAAAEVIRERGVNATRIGDVAERMDVSPPALLYYFESKDELLSEALTFAEERFYDELATELSGIESARERLVWLVESCTEAGDYDAVLWIELWPHALRSDELAATRGTLDRRWRRTIAGIIREGQERGEFGGGDPDELAALVACLLDGLAIQVALEDRELSSPRARELCLEMLERELECELIVAEEGRRAA
ncbi:MAG: TetR/AcrR family transcriptional regulator [Microbacterium sp.]|uniref:TetR/AcrR family transcriptional regulator n=1 Tax=Microbacterium sp. TaxID=51671 RepID=UPI003D6EFB20